MARGNRKKTPDTNVKTNVDPGTGELNRNRKGPLFEEAQPTDEIPNYGVERLDNVGTGPDDTGGNDGPDDF